MRLFIAVLLSGEIKDELCGAIDRLRRSAVRGNFTRRDNLHLTLVFLGETERADAAIKAMETAGAGSFTLTVGGSGRFKRDGGDIYWAGVTPSDELQSLYDRLCAGLAAAGFSPAGFSPAGFSPERRVYRPHLTLGREVLLPDGWDKKSLDGALPEISMPVTAIHLMKSERIGGMLRYTSIYKKEGT